MKFPKGILKMRTFTSQADLFGKDWGLQHETSFRSLISMLGQMKFRTVLLKNANPYFSKQQKKRTECFLKWLPTTR